MDKRKGMLIVVSGFSGVGKGTVMKEVFKIMPDLKFSVSCTTRRARENEIDGKNYFFISEEEFDKRISNGDFAEYTRTFLNGYGTLKSQIDEPIARGEDVVVEINFVGANNLRKQYKDCVSVFIVPPSVEELKRRLMGRGTETPDSIARRLQETKKEYKQIKKYDYTVVNDVASDCAKQIVNIIKSERLKTSRQNFEHLSNQED